MSITAIGYLMVYGFGLLMALLKRPIYGLYIYFFALYMHAPGRWWGLSLPDIRWSFIAAMVTMLAVFIRREGENKWLSYPETKCFLFFTVYVAVQSLWAIDQELHFEYVFLSIKFLILIFIIHATVKTEKDLISVVIVNLIGVAYFGWIGFRDSSGGRFEHVGTPGMDDGNLLAIHVTPLLISGSYLLLCKLGKKKYLLIPPILLSVNLVLLTQSRGALVAAVLAGVFALFFIPKEVARQFKIYVLLALTAGMLLVGPELIERFRSVAPADSSMEMEKSAASRIVIIEAQFEMFKENLLFGHGHRGTVLLSQLYIPPEYLTGASDSRRRGSHNLIMSMLVDHGIIGAVLYFLIFYYSIRRVMILRNSQIMAGISQNQNAINMVVMLAGLVVGLVCIFIASQSANSKKLEIDIWYFALIPITYELIIARFRARKSL
jgi:O-antigen ligase